MSQRNVQILSFPAHGDEDGWLTPIEVGKNVPFEVKRVYYIYKTANGVIRGRHAHKNLSQVLISVCGSVDVNCEFHGKKMTYRLDDPTKGLLVEGLVWRTMENFSPDAVLMVLASGFYDEEDYLRDYQDFLNAEKILNQNKI